MEFKKCSRCGNFYVSNGTVCPKCEPKDNFEFSTFKSYIAENGLNSPVETIASATGISVKNLNRFIKYNNGGLSGSNNINTQNENSGITFLI